MNAEHDILDKSIFISHQLHQNRTFKKCKKFLRYKYCYSSYLTAANLKRSCIFYSLFVFS